ncbi:aspartate aminotransferase [Kaistia algarum]|uniref:pyridoxal-phosphate-dependent aminotransferase family protein n=1 Tax=Kaistia algarum TaxID=2083279 RepID=UPI000CE835FF|nr:aminotransferase class V-fold PLP-dependent enzyme [Kaistia algarum]MCX5514787.1 aminotransferase class V-fold PLP-dependent enzyme [Kaistia algarum]PPE79551.1 aspartate aminotransferase [Kaistia algarum]
MSPHDYNALLDIPNFPPERYAPLADRIARLLGTRSDIVFVQAEALLALEAIATSVARPGLVAANIVTSPYGAYFGAWLRRGGVEVLDIVAEPGQPITAPAVEAAISVLPKLDILVMVHGEAANGALNPLEAVARQARAHGALLIIDAVASVGAHAIDIDGLGIDFLAIGPQKALGGPVGLSAVAISPRGWSHIAATPSPSPSLLSLADIKANWLDKGRGALPGTPPPLEFWALEAAIGRVEAEGIDARIARHQLAARATRTGLRAMGVEPWIVDDDAASALVTSVPVPPGLDAGTLIVEGAGLGVALGRGFGDIEDRLLRIDHTGRRAAFASVSASLAGLGAVLKAHGVAVDIGAAIRVVAAVYKRT